MFEWDEKYSVGIKEIDDQHKKMFELGREMESVVSTYDGIDIKSQLINTFYELFTYTQYHFTAEERIMTLAKYSDLDNHIRKHNQLLEKLRDLDLNIPLEDQGRLAFELLLLISDWIVKHIQGDDFAYINCIDKYLNPNHLS